MSKDSEFKTAFCTYSFGLWNLDCHFNSVLKILRVSPENPFPNATTGNGRGVVDCDRRRQSGGDQRTTTTDGPEREEEKVVINWGRNIVSSSKKGTVLGVDKVHHPDIRRVVCPFKDYRSMSMARHRPKNWGFKICQMFHLVDMTFWHCLGRR